MTDTVVPDEQVVFGLFILLCLFIGGAIFMIIDKHKKKSAESNENQPGD